MNRERIDSPLRRALLGLAEQLDPEFAAARLQYARTLRAAMAGDVQALSRLPLEAKVLLEISRDRFAHVEPVRADEEQHPTI